MSFGVLGFWDASFYVFGSSVGGLLQRPHECQSCPPNLAWAKETPGKFLIGISGAQGSSANSGFLSGILLLCLGSLGALCP